MKKYLIILLTITFIIGYNSNVFSAETKKVCHPVKDKNGKDLYGKGGVALETCKQVKIHKKLEGTKVPEKKK